MAAKDTRSKQAANAKMIKDLEQINNLEQELTNIVADQADSIEKSRSGIDKQLTIYKEIISSGKEAIKDGKISAAMLKGQIKQMQQLLDVGQDVNDLITQRRDIEEELKDATEGSVKQQKLLAQKGNLDIAIKRAGEAENILTAEKGIADLLGLDTDKMQELTEISKTYGAEIASQVIQLELAFMVFSKISDVVTDISGQIDAIGDRFGAVGSAEFRDDLLLASAQAQALGYGFEEVSETAAKISEEFGVGFEKALGMSGASLDLQKTLGISGSQAATLVGFFTQIVGHSTESAVQLLKASEALAVAEGVAPSAVMKDVADNTEMFAKFGVDGGRNLIAASIQARKLGSDLGVISGITEGLLDFQTSLNNEIEAEIMLGKDLNLQRARELALNNDIEGMMEEITSQLGSQAEFEEMNAFQRQALADAIGVSVGQMQEFIANQDKSATLADKLAQQEGFEQMVGEDALSSLAEIQNSFKTIGAVLTQSLAPAIEMVLAPFAALFGWIKESPAALGALKGAMMVLIPVLTILSGQILFSAIANLWNAAMKMAGITAGFGLPLALAAGAAGVGAIIGSMRAAKNVGDFQMQAGGAPIVSTAEGAFQLSPNDDLIAAPGVAGGGGVVNQLQLESKRTNARLDKLVEVTEKMNTMWSDGTLARMIGKESGRATGGELKTINM